jgi:integrase
MSSSNGSIRFRDGKLHLFKQPRSKNYFWRTFINGKYLTRTTGTDNLALAKSKAELEFDRLRFELITPEGKAAHLWDECEKGFLASLSLDQEIRHSRIKTHNVKLGILRQFFGRHPIHGIKTNTIEEYLTWRKTTFMPSRHNFRNGSVTNKTLTADLLTLRQVLKYAKRQEWISSIPDFPKLTVTPRAGGWFSPQEMIHLIGFAKQWIKESPTVEEQLRRDYAWNYILWLVFTGMRVDEALCVRYEDITEIHKKDPEKLNDKPYLYVRVKGGKLSYLKAPSLMIGLSGAVTSFFKLKTLFPNAGPKDLLFPKNPRDKVHQLLEAAGLLKDDTGHTRTAKNFRHTFVMSRLLHGTPVLALAQNIRSSVKMIQLHYGSYFNSKMNREELTKMLSDTKSPTGFV